ncbi:Tetratricopeptide repeat protein [Entamoeba marina]
MQTPLIISLSLIDGRNPSTLSQLYKFPSCESFEEAIVTAQTGNALDLLKQNNVTMNEVPLADISNETKLIIGVALLNGFSRQNFVGPFNLPLDETSSRDVQFLTIDGEHTSHHVANSLWLHTAAKIFGVLKDKNIPFIDYFIARQATIHQRVLENPAESLFVRIGCHYRDAMKEIESLKDVLGSVFYDRMKGKAGTELAIGMFISQQFKMFSQQLNTISQQHKLFIELSGAFGKRTKFQEKETAQLYLKVDRIPHPLTEIKRQKCDSLLVEAKLDETSDMLDYVNYTGDVDYTPLSTYDEGVVLLSAMNRYRKAAKDELILEQVIPYCNRVLRDKIDFSMFIMAVLLKSRYEATVKHFLYRSVEQSERIIKMFENTQEIDSNERLESFYLTTIPPIYSLRKEIGMRMLLMGNAASAINYFTAVGMKIEIVAAYLSNRENDKAEKLCRELMESGNRESELLCLMYEITGDVKYLNEAWEESNHTYIHAQRVLGQHCFKKKEIMLKQKEHFDIALKVNPIYQRLWFALGVSCLQLRDIPNAKRAFLKAISLDSDDGQCWANLASIHSLNNDKRETQVALKEAVRCIRTNAELWKNLIIISIDIGDYRQAICGLVEVYECDRSAVNAKILSMMCDVILQDIPMLNGESSRSMKGMMVSMLKKIVIDFKTTDTVYQVAKRRIGINE